MRCALGNIHRNYCYRNASKFQVMTSIAVQEHAGHNHDRTTNQEQIVNFILLHFPSGEMRGAVWAAVALLFYLGSNSQLSHWTVEEVQTFVSGLLLGRVLSQDTPGTIF